MAAGQHRVSRRRVFDGYSRKEISQYRNGGGRDAEVRLCRDVEPRSSSKFWNSRSKQDGFGGTRKELGVLSSGIGSYDAPISVLGLKDGDISASEYGAELHPQKKTKFSPIIWDKKEKEVRVSSKNRVVITVALSSPVLSPPRLSTQASECSSDGSDSKSPVVQGLEDLLGKAPAGRGLRDTDISGFPVTLSPLPSENIEGDNQKGGGQMEKEDCFPTRNISTSRWASACDSPICQQHTGRASLVLDSMMSSPESGEFVGEGSERVNHGSSMSDDGHSVGPNIRDGCSENGSVDDDSMDIDENHDKNVGVNQLNSDSEDDIDFQGAEEPVRRNINMLQGCRSVFEYEKLNRISEGTYGVVYRARDKKTGDIVALKKVKMDMERDGGFPLSALREINILLSIQHPSVVNVKEVVMGDLDSVFMVMEYMEHDLKGLMEKMKHPFSISEVKCLMQQLLAGVKCLHDNWVLHRDLKTSNLLVNNKGELKICDLGMSRQYGSPLKPFTSLVVTLWYRAPELLLGTKQYSTAIDMWSVGCIMAELLAKKPLFAGGSEVSQLDKIFEVLGTPNESNWPGYSELPGPGGVRVNFKAKQPHNQLRKKFPATSFTGSPALSESGFDLLKKLLTYDPEKRISAEDALDHDWFREVPLPKSKDFMPTFPPSTPK